MWCVVVCDLKNLKNKEAMARDSAASAIEKKIITKQYNFHTGSQVTSHDSLHICGCSVYTDTYITVRALTRMHAL